MQKIYLDHNVIVDIAGLPGARNSTVLRMHIERLKSSSRFVMSSWNMYELARSVNQEHVDQCCKFVEALRPLRVSDASKVKRQEVDRFLQPQFDNIGPVRNRNFSPFHDSVHGMWSSFGEAGNLNETFTTSVAALRAKPEFLADIDSAAAKTPDAIQTGRSAFRNGHAKLMSSIIDREYLKPFLPPGGDSEKQLDYLIGSWKRLMSVSPALAVDNEISSLHIRDSFKPESADAADLQHVIVALGYCDFFVTNDRQLVNHSNSVARRLSLSCRVCRSVEFVP